jgi:hypothetical protein
MIDPSKVCLFLPSELTPVKRAFFKRIGRTIEAAGGRTCRGNYQELAALPDDIIPIVGASPKLRPLVHSWRERQRMWIGWDRGYLRRVYATWLPRAESIDKSFYRWTINAYQMRSIGDVPADRWLRLNIPISPWRKSGRHIVMAAPSPTYLASHEGLENWIGRTLTDLRKVTDRRINVRDKESAVPLQSDLEGAHCLVTHGSIAAVEAVVCGCPVFVHPDSAASLVGLTDLEQIETPIYPERQPWLNALAYSQWNEHELIDGTLWRMIV